MVGGLGNVSERVAVRTPCWLTHPFRSGVDIVFFFELLCIAFSWYHVLMLLWLSGQRSSEGVRFELALRSQLIVVVRTWERERFRRFSISS